MKKVLSLLLTLTLIVAMCPLSVSAADVKVTITKTNIKADSVVNESGYGSLMINGVYSSDYRVERRPQAALVDKTGKLLFNYRDSYNRFRYDADSGIISLAPGDPYASADDLSIRFEEFGESELIKSYPSYYKPDGSTVFSLPANIGPDSSTSYYAGPISNGLATVIYESNTFSELSVGGSEYSAYVVNKAGEKVFDLPAEFSQLSGVSAGGITMNRSIGSFGEGLAPYFEFHFEGWDSYDNALGYMDATGKTVIDLSSRGYTNAGRFVDGLAYVGKDGKVGYIDKSGKEVIPFEYDTVYEFSYGLAAVQKAGKYGFIDKTGKTVVPFVYDNSFGSGDGLLTVVNNGKCGLIDTSNNVVVPLEYDDISTYENGVAYAIKGGYLYIITVDEGSSTTPTTSTTPTSFSDVAANAWYAEPVKWAVDKGITNGTGKNAFSPDKTCNNAEILTFLWRACDKPAAGDAGSLSDVASGAWYAASAAWAKSKGMISGDKLSPETPCTRASAVMFIWQALGSPATSRTAFFTDVPADADYAAAVAWAVEKGVTNGTGKNTFSPDKTCTRAEIVTFLYRSMAE